MRILYAIQATGNGHISRAREIIPYLQNYGEVDLLISGNQAEVGLSYPIKYKFTGLSFIFGKKGGIDFYKTIRNAKIRRLIKDIWRLPVHDYDLIINDFEPVTAWSCRLKAKWSIGLSHQAAVLNESAPQSKKKDSIGRFVLRNYAPASMSIGLHFKKYNSDIFTPIIRNEIRALTPSCQDHYTVYLPAYKDKKLIYMLNKIPGTRWEIFSKHSKKSYKVLNTQVQPINNEKFAKSMASSKGVLMGAGFEGPSEALFLKKKLMVVPMRNQYEQQCNAAALAQMGVAVISTLKTKHLKQLQDWVAHNNPIEINYPDQTQHIIHELMLKYLAQQESKNNSSYFSNTQVIGT